MKRIGGAVRNGLLSLMLAMPMAAMAQEQVSPHQALNIAKSASPAKLNHIEQLMKRVYIVNVGAVYKDTPLITTNGGTAFIYKQDREFTYLLTNQHVAEPKKLELKDETYGITMNSSPGCAHYELHENADFRNPAKAFPRVVAIDATNDYAVLIMKNKTPIEKPFPSLVPYRGEVHLGDEVTMIGFPMMLLRYAIPGHVSSLETVSTERESPAIQGYSVQFQSGIHGASGSPVFISHGGKQYLLGMVNTHVRSGMTQVIGNENFYDAAMRVTGDAYEKPAIEPCQVEKKMVLQSIEILEPAEKKSD